MLIPIVTCLLLQTPAPAPPGAPGRPTPNPERQLQHLQEVLQLTEAQVPKVRQILEAQARQAELDRAAAEGDRKALLKAARKRMDTLDTAMAGVLDREQLAAYQRLKAQAMDRLKQQAQAGRGPVPG